MKAYHVALLMGALAAAVSAAGARRAAGGAASVPPEAVGWHGAAELYGRLARWAGTRALQAEARYWEAVRHG